MLTKRDSCLTCLQTGQKSDDRIIRTTCHLLPCQQISNGLSKGTHDHSLALDTCTCSKLALQTYLTCSNNFMNKNKNIFAMSPNDANKITFGGQVTQGNPYKYILVLFFNFKPLLLRACKLLSLRLLNSDLNISVCYFAGL